MNGDRLDRNIRFFGKEGQERLRAATVAVVGVGGLGTHVVQQLSLLGVGGLSLIDKEELDETNKNRYVGAFHNDPVPGLPKVDLGERLVKSIDPLIRVAKAGKSFISADAFALVKQADYVFGCLDSEGIRLMLNELCAAYSRPFFDLATEIVPGADPRYGGRVCAVNRGQGCLMCLDLIDIAEAQIDLSSTEVQRDHDAIYGVDRTMLDRTGPAVVSINGVVASLAVTEFLADVTGLRSAHRLLFYHGHLGKVTVCMDEPRPDCYYCTNVWGRADAADVERYLRGDQG